MGTQFVALLLGAALVLGVREARRWWQVRAEQRAHAAEVGDVAQLAALEETDDDGFAPAAVLAEQPPPAPPAEPVEAAPAVEPEWQPLLNALRPVRDRGWEGPVGQPAEESWPMVLLVVFVGTMAGLAFVAGPWRWATFLLYFLLGLGSALTALGLADWQSRVFLPPGGRSTLVRGVLACLSTAALMLWAPHTTYRGLEVASTRDALLAVPLKERPRELADQFHGPGLALAGTIAFAGLLTVSLLLLVIVEVSSTRAMTAVGRGSRRRSTLWWAQFYRDRQPPLWGRYLVLTVLGFALSAGVLLRLWDSTLGKP